MQLVVSTVAVLSDITRSFVWSTISRLCDPQRGAALNEIKVDIVYRKQSSQDSAMGIHLAPIEGTSLKFCCKTYHEGSY